MIAGDGERRRLPLLLPISGNSGEVLPCPAFVGDGESFHPRDDCGENARLVASGFGAPRIVTLQSQSRIAIDFCADVNLTVFRTIYIF
jgi:hypothetical protein